MTHRSALSLILGASMIAFAAPSLAEAATVFTNFGPGLSYDFTTGSPVGSAFDGFFYAEANAFTPSATGALLSIRIALSCAFTCPGNVLVSVAADSANQPGVALETFAPFSEGSLGPLGTNNLPLLLTSVLHPTLTLGTKYWVTVSGGVVDNVAWNLNSTGDTSDQAVSFDGAATWFSPSGGTPGALEVNTVAATTASPEPGTSSLLVSGGLLFVLGRRLQRRRSLSRQSAS